MSELRQEILLRYESCAFLWFGPNQKCTISDRRRAQRPNCVAVLLELPNGKVSTRYLVSSYTRVLIIMAPCTNNSANYCFISHSNLPMSQYSLIKTVLNYFVYVSYSLFYDPLINPTLFNSHSHYIYFAKL